MSWATINEKGIQSGWKNKPFVGVPSAFLKTKTNRCGCGKWIDEKYEECYRCHYTVKTGVTTKSNVSG